MRQLCQAKQSDFHASRIVVVEIFCPKRYVINQKLNGTGLTHVEIIFGSLAASGIKNFYVFYFGGLQGEENMVQ